jgi:predicted alpha/beta superfamily hydrolase
MKYLSLIFLALVAIHGTSGAENGDPATAGTEKYSTDFGEKMILDSKILNESREIYIGLPADYNDSTEYPLVMILEAEVLFETIAPLTRLMAGVNEIPACIVVGIPFYNRYLEYAPKISGQPESGDADKMLDFYREELFPALESRYSLSNDRIIWAHSALGGIFCTYLLLGPDEQFTGILASSPSLKWMKDYVESEKPFEMLSRKGRIFYYLTMGDSEGEEYMGDMYRRVEAFHQRLAKEAPPGLDWEFRLNENDTHFSNAIETYIDGLSLYFKHRQSGEGKD